MSKSTPAGQLSLFDFIEQEPPQDDDLTTRGPFAAMPEYYVNAHTWANGDTSPAALESLSRVLLGDTEVLTRPDTHEKFKYRIVTTAVIGQKVWCACHLVGSFKVIFGQALGDEE